MSYLNNTVEFIRRAYCFLYRELTGWFYWDLFSFTMPFNVWYLTTRRDMLQGVLLELFGQLLHPVVEFSMVVTKRVTMCLCLGIFVPSESKQELWHTQSLHAPTCNSSQLMKNRGKVWGHLVDGWEMAMEGPGELGTWLERRVRDMDCDSVIKMSIKLN